MLDFILKKVVLILLPFIQMFGIYVIFHGHLSPGGSFAGGIIVAVGFICYSLVFGAEQGQEKIPHKITNLIESFGTLWYGLLGLVGVFRGAGFLLNKGAVAVGQPGNLFSGGLIFLITFGVGLKVASTMVTLFFTLTEEE